MVGEEKIRSAFENEKLKEVKTRFSKTIKRNIHKQFLY